MSARGNRGCLLPGPALALPIVLLASVPLLAQPGCELVPDDHNPAEKMLRCGENLTIHSAANTRYEVTDRQADEPPKAVRLDAGALLIEFKPTKDRPRFQILTPHAIAAVRGTEWAVEVSEERSSTLVVLGYVQVTRRDGTSGVLLRAGQGADVSSGSGPIMAKRWARPRVQALLARFGR